MTFLTLIDLFMLHGTGKLQRQIKTNNMFENVPNNNELWPLLGVGPCLKPKCPCLLYAYLRFVKILPNNALIYVDLPTQYPDEEDKQQNPKKTPQLLQLPWFNYLC